MSFSIFACCHPGNVRCPLRLRHLRVGPCCDEAADDSAGDRIDASYARVQAAQDAVGDSATRGGIELPNTPTPCRTEGAGVNTGVVRDLGFT